MENLEEETRRLARNFYEVDEGVQHVIRLTQTATAVHVPGGGTEQRKKIGLLEVNEFTVPSGVMPLEFAPIPESGIHYPVVVIEVTPDEYDKLKAGELSLPSGWQLGDEIPRADK